MHTFYQVWVFVNVMLSLKGCVTFKFWQWWGWRDGLCETKPGAALCRSCSWLWWTHHRAQLSPSATCVMTLGNIFEKESHTEVVWGIFGSGEQEVFHSKAGKTPRGPIGCVCHVLEWAHSWRECDVWSSRNEYREKWIGEKSTVKRNGRKQNVTSFLCFTEEIECNLQ